jgi:PhoPQ-activated pathogenicity-related protein
VIENHGLFRYTQKPDASYRWWQNHVHPQPAGDVVYDLHLESQQWQGLLWKHMLQVFVPAKIEFPDLALLKITGEMPSVTTREEGRIMAEATGMICATLHDVPNQPLFDDRFEDDLIAYTFTRYLDTGDLDWPLLFPMVKSAMRAMDALQEFTRRTLPGSAAKPLQGFIVTGASKRGWTTWLAAVADPRVKAILPQVYDNLNLFKQMPHQVEVWDTYSEMIGDYTEAGLLEKIKTPEGRKLTLEVDPYTYRDRLKLPKLLLHGTNDRYWATDALNLYWNDLDGPKYVLYVPNCGHGLFDERRLFATVTAFVRAIATNSRLPDLDWTFEESDSMIRLKLTSDTPAVEARLWIACSSSQDFRDSEWLSVPIRPQNDPKVFVGEFAKFADSHIAVFGEIVLPCDTGSYTLSTQIHIAGSSAGS